MSARTRWQIIGRGWSGWHAAAPGVKASGGDLNPYTYWTGEKCAGYAAEAAEGATVYDASDADRVAFAALVVNGPIAAPELPAGTMVRGFGASVEPAAGPFRALDRVAVDIYRDLLRSVPGCRLGAIHGGAVVWDNTEGAQ